MAPGIQCQWAWYQVYSVSGCGTVPDMPPLLPQQKVLEENMRLCHEDLNRHEEAIAQPDTEAGSVASKIEDLQVSGSGFLSEVGVACRSVGGASWLRWVGPACQWEWLPVGVGGA